MLCFASFLIGSIVGLMAATMFSVILRRIEQDKFQRIIKVFMQITGIVFGAGLADYMIFDIMLGSNDIICFTIAFLITFSTFSLLSFLDWIRK